MLRNVELGLEFAGVPREERRATARRHLELVELAGFDDYHPKQISGGMKQKAALARSLAVEPRVLLLDEPFAALDAQTRNALQEVLLHVLACTRTTVVFVTHNVDEAVFLGDTVVCLTAQPTRVGKSVAVDVAAPAGPDRAGAQRAAQGAAGVSRRGAPAGAARGGGRSARQATECGPRASQSWGEG